MIQVNLFNNYQAWTDTVAQYPETAEANYLSLGISDEGGELAEAYCANKPKAVVMAEAGDVLWYVARYLRRVLHTNLADAVADAYQPEARLAVVDSVQGVHGVLSRMAVAQGKIAGVEKKRIRDGASWDENTATIKHVVGYRACVNILAGLIHFADIYGSSLESIAQNNRAKLDDRRNRDVIRGDGDKR